MITTSPLAILGGAKAIQEELPQYLSLSKEELDCAMSSLQHTPLTTLYGGYEIESFENGFNNKFGFMHSIAVNSGTSALHAAIVALGIGPGDEVITTTYSFVASVSVIVQERATPVFCDINPNNLGLDVEKCLKLITPKTKAIIAVHIYGTPMEIDQLHDICKKNNIYLIEDCAGALGAKYNNRFVGTFGDISCFSFNIHKILRVGEGGMAITPHSDLAIKLRELRVNGLNPKKGINNVNALGFNYTMPQIMAALGCYQLRIIDKLIEQRCHNASVLKTKLENLPFKFLQTSTNIASVPYNMPMILDNEIAPLREKIIEALQAEGVPAHKGYGEPLYKIDFLQPYSSSQQFPISEVLLRKIIVIDPSPFFTELQIEKIAIAIRKVFDHLEYLKY